MIIIEPHCPQCDSHDVDFEGWTHEHYYELWVCLVCGVHFQIIALD